MDIVRLMGGLGNQMFQYAFLKALESKNRVVRGSLGFYDLHPELAAYELDRVFPNIQFKLAENSEFLRRYNSWCDIKKDDNKLKKFLLDTPNRFFWNESKEENGNYQEGVFLTTQCTFTGYWQSYRYFQHLRERLIHDFYFEYGEDKLFQIKSIIEKNNNYVSVHFRRGDYLKFNDLYGNICTSEYYRTAFNTIEKYVKNPIYVFFSDDVEWVKSQNFKKEARYIAKDDFENYQNWYDMSLMASCSHNIIANSSFSWWGAWLNNYNKKIVIAPKKWKNGYDFKDICPPEWIKI